MNLKNAAERIRAAFLQPEKKNRLLILIGVLGVILLFLSEAVGNSPSAEKKNDEARNRFSILQESTQKQVRELVESVDGAGKALVMVSFETDGEQTFATDKKTESSNGERTTESSRDESVVLVDGDSGDTGLLVQTIAPMIRGVAVVCEGGGSAAVKREVTETVSAALGLSREKIYVAKMKNEE